jgi:hypothetical protein
VWEKAEGQGMCVGKQGMYVLGRQGRKNAEGIVANSVLPLCVKSKRFYGKTRIVLWAGAQARAGAYHLQICTHPRKGPLRGVEGKGVCVRLPRRKSGEGKGCVWESSKGWTGEQKH